MREIKFRAWDVERKSWMNEQDAYNEVQEQGRWNPERGQFYKLMQFTGLYDKNGKEIYEGDIYKWRDEIGTITYDNACFNCTAGNGNNELYSMVDDIEIIGNIYENPELIKA